MLLWQCSHYGCRQPEAAIAATQEMERINALLQQVADRGDEIKDLRTRHELTVKRNTEAKPPAPPDLRMWSEIAA